jgi:hypothetical protein
VPDRKKTISLLGQNIQVTNVPILKKNESISEYELEDGSKIQFRAVATAVLRLDGQYDGEGNPIYLVKNGQIVTATTAGEGLRRKPE